MITIGVAQIHNGQSLLGVLKGIKLETSLGQVETGVMHVVDVDTSATDLRVGAIHSRNPLHTFMFNADGNLLNANTAALGAFGHCHSGIIQLTASYRCCLLPSPVTAFPFTL